MRLTRRFLVCGALLLAGSLSPFFARAQGPAAAADSPFDTAAVEKGEWEERDAQRGA
jgi:hypothetical protein